MTKSPNDAKYNQITPTRTSLQLLLVAFLKKQLREGRCSDKAVSAGIGNGRVQLAVPSSQNEKLFKAIHQPAPRAVLLQ